MLVRWYKPRELTRLLLDKCKAVFGVGRLSEEYWSKKYLFLYSLAELSENELENWCKFSLDDVHKCMQQYRTGGQITIMTPQRLRRLHALAKETLQHLPKQREAPRHWRKRLRDFDKKCQWILMSGG